MAKSLKRSFHLDDAPLSPQAGDPGDGTNPLPKPPLFTNNPDVVNFNNIKAGQYDPASFHDALYGNDWVTLPRDQATATALGYNPSVTFHGGLANDTVIGGTLNDRVSGDSGSDKLYGFQGDDTLTGADSSDQLFGGTGNDQLLAGTSIDEVHGGEGNDIILSLEDDQKLLVPNQWVIDSEGNKLYYDRILGEAGDDFIFATNFDNVDGGDGNDTIQLLAETAPSIWQTTYGGDGNDTIIGSPGNDRIGSGHLVDAVFPSWWSEAADNGGFTDTIKTGNGHDSVSTMAYCHATVDTGKGRDSVTSVGLWDIITTGEDNDSLLLHGGACKADLGAGDDVFTMAHAAYTTTNSSEITLGAGADTVKFETFLWFIEEDLQSLADAPLILDFDLNVDVIDRISTWNGGLFLDKADIKTIDIAGGSALVYDDPTGSNGGDFVYARFNGVTAQELQVHIDQNTSFI